MLVSALILGACSGDDNTNGAISDGDATEFLPLPALPAGVNECDLIDDATASDVLGEAVESNRGGQRSPAVGCTWSSASSDLKFYVESTVSQDLTPDLVCQHSAQAQVGFTESELVYVADALAVWGKETGLILCLDEGSLRFDIVPAPSDQESFQSQAEQLAEAAISGLRALEDDTADDSGSSAIAS